MIIEDILTIPPNWNTSPTLERTWKTGIQTSIKGLEIRSALFTYPRKKLSFAINGLSSAQSALLKRVLWGSIHKVVGVPFWMDRTDLTAQANSGQNILQVGDTSNRNFEVGAPCLIMTSYDTYEYAEISAIGATSITLDTNLTSTWATGSVYPILQGRFDQRQTVKAITSAYTDFTVNAEEAFDVDVVKEFIGADPFLTYLSRPVFTLMPNWKGQINTTIGRPYEIWKFLGKETVDYTYEESVIGTRATFTFYNREDLYEFIKFFDYCRGRWGRFYCPTWTNDVVITSAISSSDTIINIEDIEWDTYWDVGYGVGPAGSNLFFYAPDGTMVAKQVDSAPSSLSLQLGSAIGFDCPAGQLGMLLTCFLPLSRFATDSIQIKHLTEEAAEVDVTFTAITAVSSYSSSSSSSSSSSRSSSSSSSSSLSSSSSSSSSSSWSSSSRSSSSSSVSSSSRSSSSSSVSSSSSSRSSSSRSSSSRSSSSSSSSSTSALPPAWYDYTDNTYWQVTGYGSWTGSAWNAQLFLGDYYLQLGPIGGWEVDFRPTKFRMTFALGGGILDICNITGNGNGIVVNPNYTSLLEVNTNFSAGYDIDATYFRDASFFQVSKIEFYY